jgi:hypothetical protein
MPFTKRRLSDAEVPLLNLHALGVVGRRAPPREWNWAVDSERDAFYTQLISDTYEMREGDYWYLLVVHGKPFVFKVDPYRLTTIDGESWLEAMPNTPAVPTSELALTQQLADEAHRAFSSGERLLFRASRSSGAA